MFVVPSEHDRAYQMCLNINNIVGADGHPVPDGVDNKTRQNMYTLSLSFSLFLTCKAIPFNYKRGCALSQQGHAR